MIELHCHLDGLVGPGLLERLAARGLDYGIDRAAVAAAVPVRSMAQWLEGYAPLVRLQEEPRERLIPILELHIEELIRQRVDHAELMLAGLLQPDQLDDGRVVERFRRFREAADRAAAGRIEVVFLAAVNRTKYPAAARFGDRMTALARAGLIAGVAIAGDENACSMREWTPTIDRLRGEGLGIEIHAGEMAGPASVRDALAHGKPDRIGHGVRAFEDESLVAELRARDIHLEFCPTSNLCLGVVPSIERHPIARARALGMNFSVSSDDPGPFACTFASERALVTRAFGFGAAEWAAVDANARRSAFGRPRAATM